MKHTNTTKQQHDKEPSNDIVYTALIQS